MHIAAIVNALRELGHEVGIVGPTATAHRPDGTKKLSLAGRIKRKVPRLVFEVLQLGYNIAVYLRLRRAVHAFKPDMIYERYALFSFAGIVLAKQMRIPLILEVNTPYAQAWAKYIGLNLRRLARWIEKRTLAAANHIITVTDAQRQLLVQEGVPIHNITVCHNAIDPFWFDPARHDGLAARKALGLQGVVVGFVGTMNRWQGITEFPTLLRDVLGQSRDVYFLMVGDGEFRAQLQEFCRAQGFIDRVVFTGRKSHAEVPRLLAAIDIAILLNSNDYGSPMKLFEYMAMEKAVIAPAVGPVKEVLNDGETGLLIKPGDASEMAQKIVRLVNDPVLRRRLGTAGRAHVAANHTWRQNAIKALDAYARIGSVSH